MTTENELCGGRFPCDGKISGSCAIVKHVHLQAGSRGWTKKGWENFIGRVRKEVVPECALPSQLKEAITEARPDFRKRL